MFRSSLILLFILFFSDITNAQTHPCDIPPQVEPTKGNKVGWCHDRKDQDNLLYGDGQLGFKVFIGVQSVDLGSVLIPIGGPSPVSGLYYFEVPIPIQAGRGMYPVAVLAYSVEGDSALSSPTVTWQVGGPPSVPKNPRIK